MRALVGEITDLVWQNTPLPPPPADLLSANSNPDLFSTPTNQPAPEGANYENIEIDIAEVIKEQPDLPPRQPCRPPRKDLPVRIPLSEAGKWSSLPPRIPLPPRRDNALPVELPLVLNSSSGLNTMPIMSSAFPTRIPLHNGITPPSLPPRDETCKTLPSRNFLPPTVPLPPRNRTVYSEVNKLSPKQSKGNVIVRDLSPYVVDTKCDPWQDYNRKLTDSGRKMKSKKVKIPQR